MVPVFLASVTPYAGKNVVALGLARKFRNEGKSVGYFKPIGPLPVTVEGAIYDEDAVFFRNALSLSDPADDLCPLVLTEDTLSDIYLRAKIDGKQRITRAFRKVSDGKDVVICVNMGRLSCGWSLGYPMHDFIRDTHAKLIVVDPFRWPLETFDGILHMKNMVGENFAGVIFNRIPAGRASRIEEAVKPFLKSHDIDVFGVIREDTVLGAVPVRDMVDALSGKVLCAGNKLDQLVERLSIGAMKGQAALQVFQRLPHKAVITGGDRAEIQIAALQTSTRCIILTGNLHPNERILTQAEEQGVPVILVEYDTATTAEICERLHGHISVHSQKKIERTRQVVDDAIDWALLNEHLGTS